MKVKNFALSFTVYLSFLGVWANAISTVAFEKLVASQSITVTATSKGGFQGKVLEVTLISKMTEPVQTTLPAGTTFQCSDVHAQDLIVLENYPLKLLPKTPVSVVVFTNCIEPENYAPHVGASFVLKSVTSESFRTLANLVAQNVSYQSQSQQLFWLMKRKPSVYTYTTEDSVAFWPLLEGLKGYVELKKYQAPAPPKPKYVYATRVNIVVELDKDQPLSLAKYDTQGKLLKTYYEKKTIASGMYVVTLGHNDIVEDTSQRIVFKLTNDKGQVLATKTGKNNLLEGKVVVWSYQALISYELSKPLTKATLLLVDDKGKIVRTLFKGRDLPAGKRQTPYSFFHTLGERPQLKIQVRDEKDTVIQEIPIRSFQNKKVP